MRQGFHCHPNKLQRDSKMQSALIVHSKHTKDYAKSISKKYKDVEFLEVTKQPTEEILNIKNDKDVVIGVGGGSVIDTAKIISKDKRCIVIPTTAAGASMTPYATIWGREKISIPTKKPILMMKRNVPSKLPSNVLQSTLFDALSHAIESFWSKNATLQSRRYSKRAIQLINSYLKNKDINMLITAGNLAGQAIAITKTNVVHATSYPLTIKYGISHGTACGMLLPHFVSYMDFKELPKLFNLGSTEELVVSLKKLFIPPKIENLNVKLIAKMAMRYDRVNHGPKKISKKSLEMILGKIEQ